MVDFSERRRICVFSGSRADYGLSKHVWKDLATNPSVQLQIICSGSHMETSRGLTVSEILEDGFQIDATITLNLTAYTNSEMALAFGELVKNVSSQLTLLEPQLLVLVGDRYETFAAACAAYLLRIPIAHLYGGETTAGALDENMRHAITKLASLHFTTHESHARRVLQLGEPQRNVLNFGSPALCSLERDRILTAEEVANEFGISMRRPYMCITYQPETFADDNGRQGLEELLGALDICSEFDCVFTGVNADPGSSELNQMINDYVASNATRSSYFLSLGHVRYLSLLKYSSVCVGNSSSGILEAPALKVPTVNIGDRQSGRERSPSVIDVKPNVLAISAAIRKSVSEEFLRSIDWSKSAFLPNGASEKIANFLASVDVYDPTQGFVDWQ